MLEHTSTSNALYFLYLAHSLARRRLGKPSLFQLHAHPFCRHGGEEKLFTINRLRTLFRRTEGVPSLSRKNCLCNGRSSESGKIEIHEDGVAFGRSDFDGGCVGGESSCGELEMDDGARQAAAALRDTEIGGFAGEVIGRDLFLAIEDAELERAPEVRGAELVADGRARAGARRPGNQSAIGLGEQNLDRDGNDFIVGMMIFCGLLGAVVGLPAGMLHEKSKGSEKRDGVDMRAGGRRRQESGVAAEKLGRGFVMALTKEI